MPKLNKEKSIKIAEYAHYVQRHAHYEQALSQAIMHHAPIETRDRLIINAKWAAKEALAAAGRIGLENTFIQTDIIQRGAK